jgi:hypothetical protein
MDKEHMFRDIADNFRATRNKIRNHGSSTNATQVRTSLQDSDLSLPAFQQSNFDMTRKGIRNISPGVNVAVTPHGPSN